MQCSSMQGLCAHLTGGSICLLYICIVLDLAVGVVVCKYIYAWFDWGSICLLYICIVWYLAVGVVVCKVSVLDWLGGSICLLYICIVYEIYAVGVVVCKASMLDWLGGSICLLYICILWDLCSRCSGMQGIYAWLTGGCRCVCWYATYKCQGEIQMDIITLFEILDGPFVYFTNRKL